MSSDPRFPPALAERFRPVRPIAEGGFGAVWLARQVALDRPVALKILHLHHAGSAEAVQRFEDEARLTASIQHPSTVTLLDHGVADGVPWMAFEFIDGASLRAWVDRGPSPWRDVLQAGLQVAQALEHARQCGVIHRDIKPDNILQCGPAAFKVADFGIAKWVGATVKTATGVILGTPAYISPTQIKGHLSEHRSAINGPPPDKGRVLARAVNMLETFGPEWALKPSLAPHAESHMDLLLQSARDARLAIPEELVARIRKAAAVERGTR